MCYGWGMKNTFVVFVQRLCATSDSNGNPRRVFQVVREETASNVYSHRGITKVNAPVEYYEEGYIGPDVVPHDHAHTYINLPDVQISVSEYNKIRKLAKPS